jgi:hypothetical protein
VDESIPIANLFAAARGYAAIVGALLTPGPAAGDL